MYGRYFTVIVILCGISIPLASVGSAAGDKNNKGILPSKVYVPYEKLKGVFEKEEQGVFLSYKEFQKLWRAAQGRPAGVSEAPFEYLISAARFKGKVKEELATLQLRLTIDILAEGWVQVPVGLGGVAVSEATLLEAKNTNIVPLLRVVNGEYIFVTKGKGRYVLALDFVRQLETKPGLAVLNYRIPSAAITTLELLIPEENLKVDVEPMLAATTSQVKVDDTNATRLQAFLGSAKQVRLSWKPRTEAAPELEPVIICEQFQHINVAEALISCEVKLNYSIHRGGVDSFTIQLPGGFRVTGVDAANIARWDVETAKEAAGGQTGQTLKVKLFSPAKDKYTLTIKMERFLQEAQAQAPLVPITTDEVLRRSGLIGITYSPRRLVHLKDVKNLARVDTGQLPKHLQNRPGVTAYRFITSDYSGTIAIETTSPRITVKQHWMLGVDSDRLELRGRVGYKVERTGLFELDMNFPEPWKIESVGPDKLVDDYQLKGKGDERTLHILLKREKTGEFALNIVARAERAEPEAAVDFTLPLADAKDLQLYQGQLILLLAGHLRAEVEKLEQLQAIPLKQAEKWTTMAGLSPAMAFEFRAIDRDKPGGTRFKIAVKPAQVSAIVHRLVNIQPGSIEQEAVIDYRVRYAPVDTFYLKLPTQLAEKGVDITGANIKEKPRIDELPPEQRGKDEKTEEAGVKWAYYMVVLQSKVIGSYQLKVRARRAFQAGQVGQSTVVEVEPILAAGKLSDQSGHIAIARAETLAVGEPVSKNLIPADAGSATDLPYRAHRQVASLAFKYNAPPFELSLPVVTQKEARVFTTIVSGAIIEQVLARDGMLNTHAIYLLATSRGDRLPITLPSKAELTAVLLNGNETPVETGVSADERIVRLPPSAGQVSRFVLEISYGLKGASASKLIAPALPEEVPVQQTLWRLWIPQDWYFLGYDRVFSRLPSYQCQNMLQMLGRNQPSQVAFRLPGQGKVLDFIRQGAPGKLSVTAMGKEVFSIIIWILIIAAGVYMLKLSGFHRVLVILAAGLVAGIVHLWSPLLVNQTLQTGIFAVILVILLWAAQWGFIKLPELRQSLAARKEAASEKARKMHTGQQSGPGTTEKPDAGGKKRRKRSKQDQE
ncbi:MAG: hypothetical protein ACYS30_21250 [Planctomycetota bacterium]|jgi:hypothetical protein